MLSYLQGKIFLSLLYRYKSVTGFLVKINNKSMNDLIQFNGHEIRQIEYNGETYFSIVDVVGALTNSKDPSQYLKRLRQRDEQLKSYIGTNCTPVAMTTKTGKLRNTLAGNREAVFRIIQSIPSPNAEPFKRWLAQLGEERLQEMNDPTQAMDRVHQSFRDLGYSDQWIETCLLYTSPSPRDATLSRMPSSA